MSCHPMSANVADCQQNHSDAQRGLCTHHNVLSTLALSSHEVVDEEAIVAPVARIRSKALRESTHPDTIHPLLPVVLYSQYFDDLVQINGLKVGVYLSFANLTAPLQPLAPIRREGTVEYGASVLSTMQNNSAHEGAVVRRNNCPCLPDTNSPVVRTVAHSVIPWASAQVPCCPEHSALAARSMVSRTRKQCPGLSLDVVRCRAMQGLVQGDQG